jgi:hypothetical protein
LIYEVKENELENVAKLIKSLMENVIQLSVPLPVNMKYGERWGSMKPLQFSQTTSDAQRNTNNNEQVGQLLTTTTTTSSLLGSAELAQSSTETPLKDIANKTDPSQTASQSQ